MLLLFRRIVRPVLFFFSGQTKLFPVPSLLIFVVINFYDNKRTLFVSYEQLINHSEWSGRTAGTDTEKTKFNFSLLPFLSLQPIYGILFYVLFMYRASNIRKCMKIKGLCENLFPIPPQTIPVKVFLSGWLKWNKFWSFRKIKIVRGKGTVKL